jgi:N6-adenosine-specific RNA methylase IME4
MKSKGYRYVDMIIWEKTTVNDKPVNGSGKFVRHSTEYLLIFSKGRVE